MHFFNNLNAFKDNFAVLDEHGNRYTYSQLQDRCDRLKNHLPNENKALIFILCGNNIETITGYLSSLQAGHAAAMLDTGSGKDALENLIGIYSPEYIWMPAASGLTLPQYSVRYEAGDYQLLTAGQPHSSQLNPALGLMLTTSGSTGSPKMVKLTAGNLDANARSIVEYLKITADERAITSLPFFYSYGLSIINSHLAVGAALLLTGLTVIAPEFWEFFNAQKATSFAGVPYTYEVLKQMGYYEMELPSLRYMTQAGGKLNPDLVLEYARLARKKRFDFCVMYGQTEATARISYLPHEYNLSKHKSIGISIPGGKLKLVNENGEEIKENGVNGELVYCGPNVMMGYAANREQLAAEDELAGELKTGDIACFDDEGFFYITGRLKRFLKIFGNRVNLEDIEHYLKSAGFYCYCGGRDNLLLIASMDENNNKTVKKKIMERYKFDHSVIRVVTVKEIPKNSSGKIQYQKLFQPFLEK
ncbi:MAG: AMP-binding protein [bacterium]|nr:AMP-binding protein [bacterium]